MHTPNPYAEPQLASVARCFYGTESRWAKKFSELTGLSPEGFLWAFEKQGQVYLCHKSLKEKGEYGLGAVYSKNDRSETQIPIATFSLYQMPGCCGVVISSHAAVAHKYRKRGLGQFLLKLRKKYAFEHGFRMMLATDKADNAPETHVLSKHGFKQATEFKNKRTGNQVKIWFRELTEADTKVEGEEIPPLAEMVQTNVTSGIAVPTPAVNAENIQNQYGTQIYYTPEAVGIFGQVQDYQTQAFTQPIGELVSEARSPEPRSESGGGMYPTFRPSRQWYGRSGLQPTRRMLRRRGHV